MNEGINSGDGGLIIEIMQSLSTRKVVSGCFTSERARNTSQAVGVTSQTIRYCLNVIDY